MLYGACLFPLNGSQSSALHSDCVYILGKGWWDRSLGQARFPCTRSGALMLSDYCVTSSFLDHLPGLSVVPVAFLIMSNKLL